jgi:hypothetical protein
MTGPNARHRRWDAASSEMPVENHVRGSGASFLGLQNEEFVLCNALDKVDYGDLWGGVQPDRGECRADAAVDVEVTFIDPIEAFRIGGHEVGRAYFYPRQFRLDLPPMIVA